MDDRHGAVDVRSRDAGCDRLAGCRAAPDECVPVDEAPAGVYAVFDAGSATVTRDGGRLQLGAVEAADGWTTRIADEDADSVEIEFVQGTLRYDLDIEIDDGRFEASICRDDD